jgi:hypothetical protein
MNPGADCLKPEPDIFNFGADATKYKSDAPNSCSGVPTINFEYILFRQHSFLKLLVQQRP